MCHFLLLVCALIVMLRSIRTGWGWFHFVWWAVSELIKVLQYFKYICYNIFKFIADTPPPLLIADLFSLNPTVEGPHSWDHASDCGHWDVMKGWKLTVLLDDMELRLVMLLVSVTTIAEGKRDGWEYCGGSCLWGYTAKKSQKVN